MKSAGKKMVYHIAQFGTYDLPSLGDTMFPVIFRLEMEKRFGKDKVEIDLYSPNGTDHPYNQLGKVYGIKELESNHLKKKYDCMVIGGGEFVHFLPVEYISVDGEKKEYAVGDLWRTPQLEAQRLNIPVIWNCVGISKDFQTNDEIEMIRDACQKLQYISVRDKYSQIRLEKMAGVQDVHEVADMLWLFNRHILKEELDAIRKELSKENSFLNSDYLVLQYGTSAEYERLGEIIQRIGKEKNLEVVLLTVNYCHEDEEILVKLKNIFDEFHVVDKKLEPKEIMSVISGAKYFFGTSLHGNITAMSYGVKNLCLDMYPYFVSKMDGLFESIDSNQVLTTNISRLYDKFEAMVSGNVWDKIAEKVDNIQLQLDKHFDKIANLISNKIYEKYDCEKLNDERIILQKCVLSNEVNEGTDIYCGSTDKLKFHFHLQDAGRGFKGTINRQGVFIIEEMSISGDGKEMAYTWENGEAVDGKKVFEDKCIFKVLPGDVAQEEETAVEIQAVLKQDPEVEIEAIKAKLARSEREQHELEITCKRQKGHIDYMLELEREYKKQLEVQRTRIEELCGKNAKQLEEQHQQAALFQKEQERLLQEIKNKEGHIDLLLEVEREYEREKKSKTYRLALKFRKLSLLLFPVNSKRRFFAGMCKKVICNPKLMLHVINPRRIKNFFAVYKKEGMEGVHYHYQLVEEVENSRLNPFDANKFEVAQVEEEPEKSISDYEKLHFTVYEKPEVSIIIPVYNEFHYTYNCLSSIKKNSGDVQYEIIIADDCSSDFTMQLGEVAEGIRIIRNEKNLRFLLNCNHAAGYAKGKYILFLNNDTQVQENWLQPLVEILEKDSTVGMTGSKLVYADGWLQEAGGIFWKDASAWNYGNRKNPDDPEFNYVKEADYISGASLMIRADLWKKIGGFDERFAPAYYEDSDLAFEVRKHGYKVVYQPLSVVVHFEGVSNGTDVTAGQKAYQVTNQQKFYEKWKEVLEKEHFPNAENVFLAKDRSRFKKQILVVDHYVPHYDKDAGGKCTYMYLLLFVKMGFKVTFIGDNFYKHEPYTTDLNQHGIEVLYGNYYYNNWETWLKENLHYFDYVYLQRPHISIKYIDLVKEYSHAKVLYFAHDLHHIREYREYELTGDEEKLKSSEHWKKIEYELFEKADVGHVVGTYEQAIMQKAFPDKPIRNIPLYIYENILKDINKNFEERKDILYVGGFGHPPNIDAVLWFGKEVFPRILEKYPDMKWHVVGGKVPLEIQEMASENILIEGFLSDEDLHKLYRTCRMAVVPLRVGAGVKGKVVEAAYFQIPLVTTTIGAEGLDDQMGNMVVEDDAEKMSNVICELYYDFGVLKEMSDAGMKFIEKYFTEEEAERVIHLDI